MDFAHQQEKTSWYESNLSYQAVKKNPLNNTMNTQRSMPTFDKQNVVPCTAQIQGLISTLNTKKYELKNQLIQKKNLEQITIEQASKLDTESIKQSFQVERSEQILTQNTKLLDEIEAAKKEKLKNMQKQLAVKKALQSRFQQIVEVKKLLSDLQSHKKQLQRKRLQTQDQTQKVLSHLNDLDLMSQTLDNQVYEMIQTVRASQVKQSTTTSVLSSLNRRISQTYQQIKDQNREGRVLGGLVKQATDKITGKKQERAQTEVQAHELGMRNVQIQDINIKLRNDLQKCRNHLSVLFRQNEVLTRSLEEFADVDQKVTKLVKKNG